MAPLLAVPSRAVELPVGNHPAFIAVLHVRGRLMGVAVNDQINACGFDGFGDGRFDNIHVSHALFALFGLGLRSGLFGNGQSFLNRLHEHHGLPARIVSEGAELLISHIAQAPLVAVREQRFAAANVCDDRVADQFGARGAGKCGAQHDVTVAGHHNDASAGSRVELKQRDHG